MNTLKPPKINSGDVIGIIAPCLPVLPSFRADYERGKAIIEQMGFRTKEGRTITSAPHWYSSATAVEQAADVNAMFGDPEVKAIIATSGGYSAITVLEHLDYELISRNPKPFIGMSDITGYHLAIYAQTGMVGFHADDLIFGLGKGGADYMRLPGFRGAYLGTLTSSDPLGVMPHKAQWESWRSGTATGHLIGGNLGVISSQMGTPYFPKPGDFDGAILFWESVGRSKSDIMKILYQLKHYGVFERISGMLIGTITDVRPGGDAEINEPELRDIILDATNGHDFPIMAGMDFGHYTINLPMPIGVAASFDTAALSFRIDESAVSI